MKVRIEICSDLQETEIVIKCKSINSEIENIQRAVNNIAEKNDIAFVRGNEEFYVNLDSVLFFETDCSTIHAHTAADFFTVRKKLYELEEILPLQFVRVSKSAIVNVNHVYSIERNITAASLVKFKGTHKQIYVSRSYYGSFKSRILERRGILL